MAILRLILGHWLLTVLAFPLIRLLWGINIGFCWERAWYAPESGSWSSWTAEQLVLADFSCALLDTAGTGREGIRGCDF